MKNISNLLGDVLLQTFLIFLGIGCALSLLVGLWMLMRPDAALRLNQYFNRWFATDKLTAVLVSERNIERVLHRHHRLVGALVVGGSVYYLAYALVFALPTKELTTLFFRSWEPVALWLMAAVIVMLVAGNVFAVVIGAGLMFRPNMIANLEAWANKSYGTVKLQQALDAMRMQPDVLIGRHIRLVGVLIVAGSIYALASFWIALQCPPFHC